MAPLSLIPLSRQLHRSRLLIVAICVFALLLAIDAAVSHGSLTYFDISSLASGGTPLALSATGQTIVILSGGFDLSAGAVISLVNAVLATSMNPADPDASVVLWTAVGIAVGMGVGAFNGFFIAFLRLQPIVVTLSTMFIVQGGTLLVMERPGGFISPSLGAAYISDAIADALPGPIVLLACVMLLWGWLKRTPFGLALYAVGSDPAAAASTGIRVPLVRFGAYVLAGGLYGLAGVFVSAQTGSGDPLVGNSLLLSMFAAVVIGGTRLGGGSGGPLGTIFGAFVLMIVVNILLALNVSAYYSTIAEGTVLLLAVLMASMTRHSVLAKQLGRLIDTASARSRGLLVSQRAGADRRLTFAKRSKTAAFEPPGLLRQHAETLRYALPAYVCLAIVLAMTQAFSGNVFSGNGYWNALLVLSTFLVILALGQGTVILTGGLDLSLPWTIGLAGILLTGIVRGSDVALVYAIPLVLIVALAIGFLNGVGIVALGLSPIVVTLAMNGILQGVALLYSKGTPDGFASPHLRWFMTGQLGGV
eukprot:gene24081-25742_t